MQKYVYAGTSCREKSLRLKDICVIIMLINLYFTIIRRVHV